MYWLDFEYLFSGMLYSDYVLYVVAFAFVFALVYGLLTTSGIFKNLKNVNMILALSVSFLSLYYTPFANVLFYIITNLTIFAVALFGIIFLVYVASKLVVKGNDGNELLNKVFKYFKPLFVLGVFVIFAYTIYIYVAPRYSWYYYFDLGYYVKSFIMLALIAGVFGGVVCFAVGCKKFFKKGPTFETLATYEAKKNAEEVKQLFDTIKRQNPHLSDKEILEWIALMQREKHKHH